MSLEGERERRGEEETGEENARGRGSTGTTDDNDEKNGGWGMMVARAA